MTGLCVGALSPSVLSTSYDRNALKTRIVHLGFGAFHRGHMALYNDLCNDVTSDPWGHLRG